MDLVACRESDLAKPSAYCRKEKSLGVLCTNFLKLYDREDAKTIGLDDAATQLGVERRRMYDVVNILEIVGVVSRKAKNQYSWNGLGAISKALEKLREDGFRENFSASICFSTRVSNDDEYKTLIGLNLRGDAEDSSSGSTKNRNKRDKSLALLTQNFIKLFLCSEVDFILLENAAKALPGDAEDSTALRTKVRRLYDIANVLSSMNLIEKIRHPDSGKPAYRWLTTGKKPKTEIDSISASDANLSKQRGFGTDITNYTFKRKRDITFTGEESSSQITKALAEAKDQEVKSQAAKQSQSTASVKFGPFGPVSLSRAEDRVAKRARHVQDLENLASSFRPQYRNQALCDLFGHYMEAWKSWFVDAIGSQQMSQPQHFC